MARTRSDFRRDAELNRAAREAVKGAVVGGAWWGLISGIISVGAYAFSPVYRGLTFQFKAFLQMSGMAFGGFIEAERRMQAYEQYMRRQYRLSRDVQAWQQYEKDDESESNLLEEARREVQARKNDKQL